ncbi:hypothetical protein AVT43_gp67 [Polaribacter phage P12002L]|uniref:Uncharacterized protein n=2 Tax=Incheonvirus TaxID=2976977 RepID=A0A0F7IK21_9CAUD|nr:hypothetical protein AVT42_gp69 [Polaribacter phage P12002S]YP_009209727.1 hypothetical protein AVT43_gp67 [Polaribacter phage P12002L]AKG94241.1 hypothetical protein P12002L_0067 [Polaribacter phage P12002L]AKG94325.1 hypothetical protein P12002S_0069 [Polaribacter phage P12002S]
MKKYIFKHNKKNIKISIKTNNAISAKWTLERLTTNYKEFNLKKII